MKNLLITLVGLAITVLNMAAYDFKIDGVFYRLLDENSVEVTYEDEDNLATYSGDVFIPSSVTFDGKEYSVTQIGEMAFAFSSINSLSLPETISRYGGYAFAYFSCEGQLELILPQLEEIGEFAFYDCKNIKGEIVLPNSLKTIGQGAFAYCNEIKVTLPSGILSVPKAIFLFNSKLEQVVLPEDVNIINDNAFFECTSLREVNIPENISEIGKGAFMDCGNLTIEKLPDSLTIIGDQAFQGCRSLTGILEIPESVEKIGRGAFYWCDGISGELRLPENLKELGEYSFYNCTGLTGEIVIPQNISILPEAVFYACSGLSKISLHDEVTTVGKYAMNRCSGLVEFNSRNIKLIDDYSFYGAGITQLTLGYSIEKIGIQAFDSCNELKEISVDALVPPTIESDTFTDYSVPVIVPAEAVDTYRNSPHWSNFLTFITSGLDDVEQSMPQIVTVNNGILTTGYPYAHVKVYNLNGKQLFDGTAAALCSKVLPKGIYILSTENGNSKIII